MEQKIRCFIMAMVTGLFVWLGMEYVDDQPFIFGVASAAGLLTLCMAIIE